MSLNRYFFGGNLTRDVELKFTTANKAVANFGVAVNNKYKGADGQMKEETTFLDCEAWGATAENLSKYFTKGKFLLGEGRLKLEQWKDKNDGSNRSKMKVVVEQFHFTGGGDRPAQNAGAPAQRPQGQPAPYTQPKDEDYPF